MNVWAVYPSADPLKGEAASIRWRDRGFKTLVYQDAGAAKVDADCVLSGRFPGYYRLANYLAFHAFHVLKADLVVFVADDLDPDPYMRVGDFAGAYFEKFPDGFGVLQGTGDTQGIDASGKPAAARICGSPAFGRAWAERAYGGRGPFWNGYHSYYGDEDLYNVSLRLGVLWQEPSITIYHRHWSWRHQPQADYQRRNSENYWIQDKALFFSRQQAGFPESAPI